MCIINMEIANTKIMSVVVLTCNRKDMVLSLLYDIQRQTLISNIELIVVDNGSSDGTYEALLSANMGINVIKLNTNIGCAGRNEGLKQVSTKYVVTLDDDVFLNRSDELERVLGAFRKYPDAQVINFKILFPDTKQIIPFNWYHPRDYEYSQNQTFLTDYISEGAVAFKSLCFQHTGYYAEDFFLGHEGPDLALRFINKGYNIYYSGEIEVLHKCSKAQRTTWRNIYYDTRNYLWLLIKNYPIKYVLISAVVLYVKSFIFAVARCHLMWYFKAVRDGIIGLPCQISKREVLKDTSLKKLSEIRGSRPRILKRTYLYFKKLNAMNKEL